MLMMTQSKGSRGLARIGFLLQRALEAQLRMARSPRENAKDVKRKDQKDGKRISAPGSRVGEQKATGQTNSSP